MLFIYDFIIFCLDKILSFYSLFNHKAKKLIDGRKKTFDYLNNNNFEGLSIIWIHVSSVGEFEQAKPIIEFIREKYKENKVFITYFSSSVEKSIENYKNKDYSCYLSSDRKNYIKKFYNQLKPKLILIIKYEFWYHLINEARLRNIPIISVVSIFRKSQIYFKYFGKFFLKKLKNVSYFLVQNNKSKNLLLKNKITNVKTVGDTRFDRVFCIYQQSKKYSRIEKFIGNSKCIVIGSSWKSDIKILRNTIKSDLSSNKYIIAPHNVKESEYRFLENNFINDNIRYSNLTKNKINKKILIIDNLGMLSSIYRYGNIAYIGGAFEGTLHNTLEAAVWNIPIIYGQNKNNKKFKEATDLSNLKIAFPIKNSSDFKTTIKTLINNNRLGKGGEKYVTARTGASQKIEKYIKKYL